MGSEMCIRDRMNPAQNEAYRRAVEILADWEHKGESLLAPED